MLDRIEGRLAFLKTELKISDAQMAAWNQLADAIRTAAKHHNERMKTVFSGDQRLTMGNIFRFVFDAPQSCATESWLHSAYGPHRGPLTEINGFLREG